MKKIIILLLMLCQCTHISGQAIYQRAIYGMSLFYTKGCNTSDGGFVTMGQKYTTLNDEDIFLIKLNGNGDTVWTRTYFNPSMNDALQEVIQTKDGGFFVVGLQYVMKTDSMGFPLWAKIISVNFSAVETPNGELVISSKKYSFLWNQNAIQLTKLDSMGNQIFSKIIGHFDNPETYCIKNSNDGGFILAGQTYNGQPPSNAFLIKTDSLGNVNWARAYGGSSYNLFWSVEQTINGDYLALGRVNNQSGMFMIKTDSTGVLIWSKLYEFGFSSTGFMLSKTSDQNIVVSGTTYQSHSSPMIAKMDENGTVLWAKKYYPGIISQDGRFYGIYEATDKCLVATGSYIEYPWDGFNYIVKCDSVGNSNCFVSNVSWTSTPFLSKDSVMTYSNYNDTSFSVIITSGCFCDSTNFICSGYVGINESDESIPTTTISPNPFFEQINVVSNDSELSEIILYDIAARKLLQQKFTNSVSLNTEQLAKGIYLYEVRNKNGVIKKGKVVKD